jgi:hypothetical protein
MKIFNSLSAITLISVALAIPQHNLGDSAGIISVSGDVFSNNVGSTNTYNEATVIPVDYVSFSGNMANPPDKSAIPNEDATSSLAESIGSSESKEIKPEYRFLGAGIPRGSVKANADFANIRDVQSNVLGPHVIVNVKSDVRGVDVDANLVRNRYPYPFHYHPYYPPIYLPRYPSSYPHQSTNNPNKPNNNSNSNTNNNTNNNANNNANNSTNNNTNNNSNTLPYIVEYYRPFPDG